MSQNYKTFIGLLSKMFGGATATAPAASTAYVPNRAARRRLAKGGN